MRKLTFNYNTNYNIPTGIGSCYGTFGELMQGQLPEPGGHFLVTLPIKRYSYATFTLLPDSSGVTVFPEHKIKSRQLAEKLLELSGYPIGGKLEITSELPEGKGCASSSADMVATARAVALVTGVYIPPELLAQLLAKIEPTDGVMYPGIVSFHHKSGLLRQSLGFMPPLVIVAVDEGGQVDTQEYNHSPNSYTQTEQQSYRFLLEYLEKAIAKTHLRRIGEIATSSALLNQSRLPKPHLKLFLELNNWYNALGVVVAHSGTYIGLLLDPTSPDYLKILSEIKAALQQYVKEVEMFQTATSITRQPNWK